MTMRKAADPPVAGPADGAATQTVVTNYTAILSGQTWYGPGATDHPALVTYSFSTAAQPYLGEFGGSQELIDSFQPLTSAQIATARQALAQWSAASGMTFVEVPAGQGDIQFGRYDFSKDETWSGFDGYAYYPHIALATGGSTDLSLGGDVFLNSISPASRIDEYLLLHEIGHALGFKHPFEGNPTLDSSVDDKAHTVMSYTGPDPSVLGPFDHQAVTFLYGNHGDAFPNLRSWSYDAATATLIQTGTSGADTIRGTYGSDHISGTGGADLLFGSFGDDTLEGNASRDVLFGYDGNDVLDGTLGADRIDGGAGSDTFVYRRWNDSHGKGYDTVVNFNGNDDRIDAGGAVTGVDAAVTSGTVSAGTVRSDLNHAVSPAQLHAHHAVLVTPDAGDLAGKTFLIVDENGAGGYQPNFDILVLLEAPSHLGGFGAGDFI